MKHVLLLELLFFVGDYIEVHHVLDHHVIKSVHYLALILANVIRVQSLNIQVHVVVHTVPEQRGVRIWCCENGVPEN